MPVGASPGISDMAEGRGPGRLRPGEAGGVYSEPEVAGDRRIGLEGGVWGRRDCKNASSSSPCPSALASDSGMNSAYFSLIWPTGGDRERNAYRALLPRYWRRTGGRWSSRGGCVVVVGVGIGVGGGV